MNEQKSFESSITLFERSSNKKKKLIEKVDVKPFTSYHNKDKIENKGLIHKKFSNLENFINSFKANFQNEDVNINEDLPFKKSFKLSKDEINQFDRDGRSTENSRFNDLIHCKDSSSSNFLNNECITFKDIKKKNSLENYDFEINGNKRDLHKFNNVYDSFSDDEIIMSSQKGSYSKDILMIDIKKQIENFIIIIVFLSCMISPLHLTFGSFSNNFEIIFEFCFLFEVLFSFFTPYYDNNDNLITRKYKIFKYYIEGNFALDFISGFPHQIIRLLMPYKLIRFSTNTNVEKIKPLSSDSIFQWTIIFRLLKLLKNDFLFDFKLFHNYKINRLIKYFSIFFYLTHFSSCFWIYLVNKNDVDDNWITSANLQNLSNFDLYISSLYFNSVTIFTVGYGDIVPRNLYERIYNIFLLFFGVMLYTFAVSSVSSIFMNEDSKKVQLLNKIDILENLQKDYKLPDELNITLKQTIYLDYKKNFNERYEFLDSLPSNIKNTLTKQMYRTLIKDLKFFKGQRFDFVLFVLPFLKPHIFNRGKILFSVGELVEEMYFVISGSLSIHLGGNFENLEIGLVRENDHFGELFMQTNEISPYELKCKTKTSEVFMLKKNELIKIKNSFSEPVIKIFQESYKTLETIDKRRQQFLRLYQFENSVEGVKRLLKKLNLYLMERDFNDYYYNKKDFKDVYDFIVENEFDIVIKLLMRKERKFNNGKSMKNKKSEKVNKIDEINEENIENKNNSIINDSVMLPKNDIASFNTNINISTDKCFMKQSETNKSKSNGILYKTMLPPNIDNKLFSSYSRIQDNTIIKSSSLGIKNNNLEDSKDDKVTSLKKSINENNFIKRIRSNKMIKIGDKKKNIFENFRKNYLNQGPNLELVKEEQDLNERTLSLLKFRKDFIISNDNSILHKSISKNRESYVQSSINELDLERNNCIIKNNSNNLVENDLSINKTQNNTQCISNNIKMQFVKEIEKSLGYLSEKQINSLLLLFESKFNTYNNSIEKVNDFEIHSKKTVCKKENLFIHRNETFSIKKDLIKSPEKIDKSKSSDINKNTNVVETKQHFRTTEFLLKNRDVYNTSKINSIPKKIIGKNRYSISYKLDNKHDFNKINLIANTSKRLNELYLSLINLTNLKVFNNTYNK